MYFACDPVALEFVDDAPVRIDRSIELDATPAAVFELFADAATWPLWFPGIRRVEWTSPEPKGVGTTRTVVLDVGTVYERFLAWQPGTHFAFRFVGHNRPFFRFLIEDYRLHDLGSGRARLDYTMAYAPRWPLRIAGRIARGMFERMCDGAVAGLAAYVRKSPR